MVQVREVRPIAEGLRLVRLLDPDEHEQQPERRLAGEHALRRPRVPPKPPSSVGRDLRNPEEPELVELAGKVSAIRAGVLEPHL